MLRRLALFVVLAAVVCTLDRATKTAMPTEPWHQHARSGAWIALSIAVLAGSLVLVRIPSWFVTVSCGLLAGGVLGNLAWAAMHDGLVANPLVVELERAVVAYNVADVFVLGGILLATVACSAQAVRYRDRLPQSTVAARLARRLRG